MSNPRVQPDPTRLMWVELGWVEFFLTHHDGLSKKISSTRHYPTHKHLSNESFFLKKKKKKKDKIRNAVLFKGKKKGLMSQGQGVETSLNFLQRI